ncbi:MAG: helix-turn-helix domain-containing protein [Rhizobiaceae bacterium]|nr:helix-turn-helix domain-containing protein [Rhizobiaceae bacterium]
MHKQAYTVTETMREIGIGRSKLYAEIKAGNITPRKIGRKTIFLARDIENYLNNLPKANG